jgi:D-beta-D-heptose 7-phosphate kinase/D-beta-D-heptose 1-phosphate adenosyltransferase
MVALDEFRRLRILVTGDFYLDEYVYTSVVGVSPEMPVLRLVEERRRHRPGAAGNLAANLSGLGASVRAAGVIGRDSNGDALAALLKHSGVDTESLLPAADRRTGTLTRFIVQQPNGAAHHHLRLDRENSNRADARICQEAMRRIDESLQAVDAVFLADYDETKARTGFLHEGIIEPIMNAAARRHVPVAVTSRSHLADFAGADFVFCSVTEAATLGVPPGSTPEEITRTIREHLGSRTVCLTLAEHGAALRTPSEFVHLPSAARRVVDPCGAGDSLSAAFLLATLSGSSPQEAAYLANLAAAVAVRKSGTEPVGAGELEQELHYHQVDVAKLRRHEELDGLLDGIRASKRIVFTNGCFDLFHSGHVQLLRAAKALGDVLVVGINSDRSTRANKGDGRPVLGERDRVSILNALECVDYITVFDELTPINLIKRLRPHVLVKGGNYSVEEVVGKDIVESYGGEVVVVGRLGEVSSAEMIRAIKHASDGTREE